MGFLSKESLEASIIQLYIPTLGLYYTASAT